MIPSNVNLPKQAQVPTETGIDRALQVADDNAEPTLLKVKEKGNKTKCGNNLGQIARATEVANENGLAAIKLHEIC